jgi:hypothetical protein
LTTPLIPSNPPCTANINVDANQHFFGESLKLKGSSSLAGNVLYEWYKGEVGSEQLVSMGFGNSEIEHAFSATDGPDTRIHLVTSTGCVCQACSAETRLNLVKNPDTSSTSPSPTSSSSSSTPSASSTSCVVDFDANNISGTSCLQDAGSKCLYGDDITFIANAIFGSPVSYTWKLEMVPTSGSLVQEKFDGGNLNPIGSSVSKTFSLSDGEKHRVILEGRDSSNNICGSYNEVIIVKLGTPQWNEIPPQY